MGYGIELCIIGFEATEVAWAVGCLTFKSGEKTWRGTKRNNPI